MKNQLILSFKNEFDRSPIMLEDNLYKILKLLRGNRTQREMSNAIKVGPDDYHKWESGYKKIKLNEFISILDFCGHDFELICKEDFAIIKREKETSNFVKQLETHFSCDLNRFLNDSGISESKWWRLKNQKTDLSLIDFFKIIHFRSYLLYKLLDRIGLTNYKLENTSYSSDEKFYVFNSYMREHKFFPALTAAIYLKEVKAIKNLSHKSKVIAKKLSQDYPLILNLLNELLEKEILIHDNEGMLDFATFENNYGEGSKQISRKIYTNIFNQSLSHDIEATGDCRTLYRVAPVSKEALLKIQSLQAALSKEIYNIIINDPPDERTEIIQTLMTSFRT